MACHPQVFASALAQHVARTVVQLTWESGAVLLNAGVICWFQEARVCTVSEPANIIRLPRA